MALITPLIGVVSGILAIGGLAAIRHGLQSHRNLRTTVGVVLLVASGLGPILFHRTLLQILGAYVLVVAIGGALFGSRLFGEKIPAKVWWGLTMIALGGFVIQLGVR
jgi:hypothetical protein